MTNKTTTEIYRYNVIHGETDYLTLGDSALWILRYLIVRQDKYRIDTNFINFWRRDDK